MSAAVARRRPLAMAVSGPAGGVAASRFLARTVGLRNAIAFDMGGTTTDVCLIADGRAETLSQRRLGGHPVRLPSVGVESIGAGGGSLARAEGAALRVGPESAGARPGPRATVSGARRATVTDAHAVAGTLRADALLGEAIRVDGARARAALEPVAHALGLGLPRGGGGRFSRWRTPRCGAPSASSPSSAVATSADFTLIAYGGAGPLHAGRLAQELGMPRRGRPRARGRLLGARLRRGRGGLRPRPDLPAAARRADRGGARRPVRAARGGGARPAPRRGPPAGGDRGAGGASTSATSGRTTSSRWRGPGTSTGSARSFHALHRRLYAYATEDAVECVNLRVRAGVEAAEARLPEWPATGTGQPFAEHEAYFPETGPTDAPGVPAGGPPARASDQGSGPHRGSVGDDPRLSGPDRPSSTAPATCGWEPTSDFLRGSTLTSTAARARPEARKCRAVKV